MLRSPALKPANRPKRPWWIRWGIELGIPLLAAAAILAWQGRHLLGSGTPAPAVTFVDLDGRRHSLAELKGQPVALTFWAPWCPICKTEVGTISSVHRSTQGRAHVISVALDYPDVASVRAFIRDHHVDYPVWLGDDQVAKAFHVEAFPTTYFLDGDGNIRHATSGYTSTLGFRLRL